MTKLKLIPVILMGALVAGPVVSFAAEQTAMEKTGAYMDDSAITTKVKAEIMADSGLKSFNINVVTYNGKVQLSGFVDSQKTADHAAEKAKSVKGVKEVINSLQIK
jgi:osmotically-inducible protein OsmY